MPVVAIHGRISACTLLTCDPQFDRLLLLPSLAMARPDMKQQQEKEKMEEVDPKFETKRWAEEIRRHARRPASHLAARAPRARARTLTRRRRACCLDRASQPVTWSRGSRAPLRKVAVAPRSPSPPSSSQAYTRYTHAATCLGVISCVCVERKS